MKKQLLRSELPEWLSESLKKYNGSCRDFFLKFLEERKGFLQLNFEEILKKEKQCIQSSAIKK